MLSPLSFSVLSKTPTTFRRTCRFAPLLAVLALLTTGVSTANVDRWLPNDVANGTITSITSGDVSSIQRDREPKPKKEKSETSSSRQNPGR